MELRLAPVSSMNEICQEPIFNFNLRHKPILTAGTKSYFFTRCTYSTGNHKVNGCLTTEAK
jgi:hypothetical protein